MTILQSFPSLLVGCVEYICTSVITNTTESIALISNQMEGIRTQYSLPKGGFCSLVGCMFLSAGYSVYSNTFSLASYDQRWIESSTV